VSPATTFELLRFEATPVAPAVALVELAGRFAGLEPVRPRLLVETGGVAREMPALEAGGAPWSATFAVPLGALSDPGASFSLVPGRGPLVALPAPTEAGGDDDRFVRLARTVNDLRHRLGDAIERAGAAAERLAESEAERERLAAEVAAVREQLAAAEARAAEAHDAALTAREAQAGAEGEADLAREALARARDEARQGMRDEIEGAAREAAAAREQLQEAQARAVAAEDDARAARRELRDARARIEALLRESRTSRTAAARTRIAARMPVRDEFRAARLESEWADEDEEAEAEAEAEPRSAEAPAGPAGAPGDEGEGGARGSAEARPAAPAAAGNGAPRPGSAEDAEDAAAPLGPAAPGQSAAPLDRAGPDRAAADADDATAPLDPAGPDRAADDADDATAALDRAGPDRAADDATAALGPAAPGEPPTTAELPAGVRRGPGLWSDEEQAESVRVLRPRTRAGRQRPAAAVPSGEPGDDEVLDPAAVGARLIRPAEVAPRHRAVAVLTSPRVIVGAIFVLLIAALVLIFLGVGPV
jgi:hypothetical protein